MAARVNFIPWLVFAASLAVFSTSRARVMDLRDRGAARAVLLAGDEPSYLLMAHSVVVDGDLNLYNNRVNRDGRFFGAPKEGGHAARRDAGKKLVYSIHTPGLPILIAPAYAAALRAGVSPRAAVCVFMNLLAALLAVNLWHFCRGLSRLAGSPSPWPPLCATAAVMLTPPVLFYANLIYPELPAALLILYALRHALTAQGVPPFPAPGHPAERSARPRLHRPGPPLLLPSLAGAFLPWLSFRCFPPAIVLAAMLVLRGRAARRPAPLIAAVPLLASIALFSAYQRHAFGSINPAAGYIAQNYGERGMASRGPFDGIFGILLDRGHGILAWSPVYLLSPAGLILLMRERRRAALWLIGLLLAVYLPGAQFVFWWGGFAPPPRYMVAPAPLLGGALCYALARKPGRAFSAAFAALLAASILFGLLGCLHPGLLYRHRHLVTHYLPGFPIRIFPSFLKKGPLAWPLAAFWTAAVLAANTLLPLRRERPGND